MSRLPLPERRRCRLPLHNYSALGNICSITIAVRDRRPVFARAEIAECAMKVLEAHAEKTGVPVYAHCFMPDHVHLVVEPSPVCDLVTFVGQLKNLVQRAAWTLGVEGAFWQKGFFDHFLRSEERLERVVAYVVENPVRRGLVKTWQDYPYAGSLVFEL